MAMLFIATNHSEFIAQPFLGLSICKLLTLWRQYAFRGLYYPCLRHLEGPAYNPRSYCTFVTPDVSGFSFRFIYSFLHIDALLVLISSVQ